MNILQKLKEASDRKGNGDLSNQIKSAMEKIDIRRQCAEIAISNLVKSKDELNQMIAELENWILGNLDGERRAYWSGERLERLKFLQKHYEDDINYYSDEWR